MSSLPTIVVGIHGSLLVTGVSGNIFILIVHFVDWLKTHEHNPCNIIINSIGIFNILLQGAIAFQEISYFLIPKLFSEIWISFLLTGILTSLVLSSLWCATCLCFYYCVKIVNINTPLLQKLKTKLPKVVPWLIAFSIILPWSYGMTANWELYWEVNFLPVNATRNETLIFYQQGSRCNCFFMLGMILASLAFVIIILTGGAIITSLCRHMSRMRQNSEGSGHSRILAHLSAAKTVTSLLIFYLAFYVAFTVLSDPKSMIDEAIITIGFILLACFPTINSIILILGNRKLKNIVKKILGIKSSVTNTEVTVTSNN